MARALSTLSPTSAIIPARQGVNAMKIVVEIASPTGRRATKEYDAPSMSAAVSAAERELRSFPRFQIVRVWHKDHPPLDMRGFRRAENCWFR